MQKNTLYSGHTIYKIELNETETNYMTMKEWVEDNNNDSNLWRVSSLKQVIYGTRTIRETTDASSYWFYSKYIFLLHEV